MMGKKEADSTEPDTDLNFKYEQASRAVTDTHGRHTHFY